MQIFNHTFIPIILTQSSRRRGVRRVITTFFVSHILFLVFITKIIMKDESGLLITYIPLRPLRLCVMNFFDLSLREKNGVKF